MMGPQWLCDCNASGGAEDDHSAGVRAARHFISHGQAGAFPYEVAVYKERNNWLYTISTQEQAMKIAYPLKEVEGPLTRASDTTVTTPFSLPVGATVEMKDTTGTSIYTVLSTVSNSVGHFTHTLKKAEKTARDFTEQWKVGQPIELGELTFAEANARLSASVDAMLSAQNRYRMVAAARHLGT